MILLDTYRGSAVDTCLTKFAKLVYGVTLPMNTRGIDPDKDWLTQAQQSVNQQAYEHAKADPLAKPPKMNAIFGETPGGQYFVDTMGLLLDCERIYTSAYTPGGFLGWHTDCDEAGWYIMFSLCNEPGSEFYWVEDDQVQCLVEQPGWTIKAGQASGQAPYFWHAALTTAPKWSVIMIWDNQDAWQRACDIVTTKSSLDPVPGLILYGIFE
jgi:hypothetical protein